MTAVSMNINGKEGKQLGKCPNGLEMQNMDKMGKCSLVMEWTLQAVRCFIL